MAKRARLTPEQAAAAIRAQMETGEELTSAVSALLGNAHDTTQVRAVANPENDDLQTDLGEDDSVSMAADTVERSIEAMTNTADHTADAAKAIMPLLREDSTAGGKGKTDADLGAAMQQMGAGVTRAGEVTVDTAQSMADTMQKMTAEVSAEMAPGRRHTAHREEHKSPGPLRRLMGMAQMLLMGIGFLFRRRLK